jgi:hypothetical protein
MIAYRTPEWFKIRIGKFTASNFSKLLARPADKNASISKSALSCIEKAAAQLYYNDYHEIPDSDSTLWGIEYESKAIQLFSELTGMQTRDMGYIEHPYLTSVGATPDTQIIDITQPNKLIIAQIKCPYNSQYHRDYRNKISDTQSLKSKKSQYFWQIQGEIWITGAEYSYFISFDPRISNNERLHYVKIYRDNDAIARLEDALNQAILLRDRLLDDFRTGRKRPKLLWEYY